jgi:hypothetical protein
MAGAMLRLTAGITVATFGLRQREAFEHFGELVAELLKLSSAAAAAKPGAAHCVRHKAHRNPRQVGRLITWQPQPRGFAYGRVSG